MHRFEPPPLPGQDRPAQEPYDPFASPTAAPTARPWTPDGTAGHGAAPQTPWGLPAASAHPRGTTVLVLGILSIVLAPILGPFAWVMGRKALKEVDAAPHPTTNRGTLQTGMVLGVIGTVLMVLGTLWFFAVMGLMITTVSTSL
jgi:hypothetical protein